MLLGTAPTRDVRKGVVPLANYVERTKLPKNHALGEESQRVLARAGMPKVLPASLWQSKVRQRQRSPAGKPCTLQAAYVFPTVAPSCAEGYVYLANSLQKWKLVRCQSAEFEGRGRKASGQGRPWGRETALTSKCATFNRAAESRDTLFMGADLLLLAGCTNSSTGGFSPVTPWASTKISSN